MSVTLSLCTTSPTKLHKRVLICSSVIVNHDCVCVTDYMYDMCVVDPSGRVLYLGQGGLSTYGVVRLTRANDYVTNLNCALRLSSPVGYSLHVEVVWVDIYTPYQSCTTNPDYLRITSSGSSPTVG